MDTSAAGKKLSYSFLLCNFDHLSAARSFLCFARGIADRNDTQLCCVGDVYKANAAN